VRDATARILDNTSLASVQAATTRPAAKRRGRARARRG